MYIILIQVQPYIDNNDNRLTGWWQERSGSHNIAQTLPTNSLLTDGIADQCLRRSGSLDRRGQPDGRNAKRPKIGGQHMSKSFTAALLAGVMTASTAAFAQGVTFEAIDANQDGFVSFEEVTAIMPDMSQEKFNAADANQDNLLDPTEFKTVQP